MENQALASLSGQVGTIVWGTIFLVSGVAALAIAAARRFSGARVLIWLGVWSGMYGARMGMAAPTPIGLLVWKPR